MKPLILYTDFRVYLKETIQFRKDNGLPASNRYYAKKLGINSSSWLTAILKGTRNLNKRNITKLSKVLKHNKLESNYFETLVYFNQARTNEERNHYFQELGILQKRICPRVIQDNQYEFYSVWYHSAVRSIIDLIDFIDDFEHLASQVSPAIKPLQAKKSVELMEELGLVTRNSDGYYQLTENAITTGPEIKSLAIENFQQETIRMSEEAIDRFPKGTREFSTVTFGISEDTYGKIRDVLAEARNKIVDLANNDNLADRVYQLNMQLFPLSKLPLEKEPKK